MSTWHDPLSMELLVDRGYRRDPGTQPVRPCRSVGVIAFPAALRARAMPSGEGDSLVVKVQERELMRLPLLMPAAPEFERAGDPQIARVEANYLPAGMQDAAVAGPCAAKRDGHDVPHRRDPVATGRHSWMLPVARVGQLACDLLRDQLKGPDAVLDVVDHRGEHQLVGAGALQQPGQLRADGLRGADRLAREPLRGEL